MRRVAKKAAALAVKRKAAATSATATARSYLRGHSSKLSAAVKASGLVCVGERVGVAVSGGADSVALLFLLVELRRELGLTLRVLHFHHGLRGRAADLDAQFVERLAERLGLTFVLGRGDVRGEATRTGVNLEAAARRLRYAFLRRAAANQDLQKIAVAHTADDQAETVLAHILRGSGLSGVAGIHPRNGVIVRPLLGVARGDLRAWLKARGEKWREDATNRHVTRMRARIRKKLLPLLQKKFQPRVVEHLASLAQLARKDDALLNALADEFLEKHSEQIAGGVRIRLKDLKESALAARVVRRAVRAMKLKFAAEAAEMFRGAELTAVHVKQVLELLGHGESGSELMLPGGFVVRRHYEAVSICLSEKTNVASARRAANGARTERGASAVKAHRATDAATLRDSDAAKRHNKSGEEYVYRIEAVSGEMRVAIPELGCAFRLNVVDGLGKREETSISGEVLNYASLNFPLTLRSWRPGDRFRAQGHRKPQKLKRLLNEKRIDRWQRQGWPVLESAGELAWSRSFGAAAGFAADDRTKTGILIVEEKNG
jgi:tRNA(Ile)-lysidine synthase